MSWPCSRCEQNWASVGKEGAMALGEQLAVSAPLQKCAGIWLPSAIYLMLQKFCQRNTVIVKSLSDCRECPLSLVFEVGESCHYLRRKPDRNYYLTFTF